MFHHLIQRSLSCQCQQIARSVQIRTAAAPATLICNLISLLSPQMIIWASHQRCSLELPLGCETFMVECPSLRIVCELHLFMICVFCLHGTSFEKVSCTYRSQQFPVVLASLQTAEGVTNGASICTVPSDALSIKPTSSCDIRQLFKKKTSNSVDPL